MSNLPDVQKKEPKVRMAIERVGVERVRMPLQILTRDKRWITTMAEINSYSLLDKNVRGTNMSRFVEVFSGLDSLSQQKMKDVLITLRKRLRFDDVYLKVKFLYPLYKEAPVSKKGFFEVFDCAFVGILRHTKFLFILETEVPVSSLCPCSKEISEFGAHNQRAFVKVQVIPTEFLWLEDLISIVSTSGSSEIFPLLKRVDEKWVTEQMWKNPKFVEDICRDVGHKLKELPVKWFRVKVTSCESIHSHNAVAYLGMKKTNGRWKIDHKSFF